MILDKIKAIVSSNSLQEAENIKLSDFLLCKKEDYANMIFEKNLRTIYDRKMKQKMKSTK